MVLSFQRMYETIYAGIWHLEVLLGALTARKRADHDGMDGLGKGDDSR